MGIEIDEKYNVGEYEEEWNVETFESIFKNYNKSNLISMNQWNSDIRHGELEIQMNKRYDLKMIKIIW